METGSINSKTGSTTNKTGLKQIKLVELRLSRILISQNIFKSKKRGSKTCKTSSKDAKMF